MRFSANILLLFIQSKLKSVFSKRTRELNKQYLQNATQQIESGLRIAKDILNRQHNVIEGSWNKLGFKLKNNTMLSLEAQFLWGIFHEHIERGPDFPTSKIDRTMLLMISFLSNERGMSFEQARSYTKGIEKLHNEQEGMFTSIQKLGQIAYSDNRDTHMLSCIETLYQAGLNPNAIEVV